MHRTIMLAALALGCCGCAAVTAVDLATTPVRGARGAVSAGSKAVDLMTTSQGEADQRDGRRIRHAEERLAKLERRYRDQSQDCADGDRDACEDRYQTWNEMEALRPYVPRQRY